MFLSEPYGGIYFMVHVVSHLTESDSDKKEAQPHVSSITVSSRKATSDTDLS